jgi:glutaredoxin
MLKKILFILIVIVVFLGLYKVTSKPVIVDEQKASVILFVGDGCPHCKNVEDFIKNNNIESKLTISQKEVYYNQANQKQLADTVKNCPNIDTSQGIGVPLAFIKESATCLQGDTPIIDYLKMLK